MDELSPLRLPSEPGAWLGWVSERATGGLTDAGAQVAALKEATPGDEAILQLWNEVRISLSNVFAVGALMRVVHPDPEVMQEAERLRIDAQSFSTDLYLDAAIHAQLASLDAGTLDARARRCLDDALLAFRRSGVDRDERTRERLRALNRRESELTQTFSRGIRDGRRTTELEPADLDGLPADYVDEHPPGDDGLVAIGTDYPDTIAFLTHASSPAARTEVAHSLLNVGWPDNDPVLAELLAVREEKAHLLGYDDWPSFDAEVKMIGSGPAIPAFIDQVAEATREAGGREIDELLDYARREGEEVIDFSNWRHHLEALKRERFEVDAQEVRRYFDARKVSPGPARRDRVASSGCATRRWTPRRGIPRSRRTTSCWRRTASCSGGSTSTCTRGTASTTTPPSSRSSTASSAASCPEGVLVCNFSRGLMDPDHVVTLFHEFGHLMHHVLAGRHEWARFSGVATEWDFVEAPSQMLEEWAWDVSVLQTFATDAAGEPIPDELVARMRAADEFGKAFLTRTQTAYAAISYWFHQERPADQTARLRELFERYSLVEMVPDTHFHAAFGHLEEYTSSYYTYAWSRVIAKDLFSAFDPDDLFATEVAHRYRDRVLAPGGSKDAADLVEDFLGRPYDDRAYRTWLERQPEVAR